MYFFKEMIGDILITEIDGRQFTVREGYAIYRGFFDDDSTFDMCSVMIEARSADHAKKLFTDCFTENLVGEVMTYGEVIKENKKKTIDICYIFDNNSIGQVGSICTSCVTEFKHQIEEYAEKTNLDVYIGNFPNNENLKRLKLLIYAKDLEQAQEIFHTCFGEIEGEVDYMQDYLHVVFGCIAPNYLQITPAWHLPF